MVRVRKILAGLAATTVMSSVAMAADVVVIPPIAPAAPIPVPAPAPPFSGPYFGLLLGYGFGHKFWDAGFATTEHDVNGFVAGAEAGFRFQTGGMVFGVEGDWAWTNIIGTSDPCAPAFPAYSCTTDLDWLATLTGQVGFAPGNVLFYGEAGAAWARENFTVTNGVTLTGTDVNNGWLVGGGVVFASDNRWYIKGEYNFINFGTDTVEVTDGAAITVPFDLTQTMHVFKIGVGMQF
jgi:outer membrane immunogenic protein